MAEWWYNTTIHASTSLTPFEALYGYQHLKLIEYFPGMSQVEAVGSELRDRVLISSLLKHNLQKAQEDENVCRFKDKRTSFWEGGLGVCSVTILPTDVGVAEKKY